MSHDWIDDDLRLTWDSSRENKTFRLQPVAPQLNKRLGGDGNLAELFIPVRNDAMTVLFLLLIFNVEKVDIDQHLIKLSPETSTQIADKNMSKRNKDHAHRLMFGHDEHAGQPSFSESYLTRSRKWSPWQ